MVIIINENDNSYEFDDSNIYMITMTIMTILIIMMK